MKLCLSIFLGQKMLEEDWNVCFAKIIVFALQCILPPPYFLRWQWKEFYWAKSLKPVGSKKQVIGLFPITGIPQLRPRKISNSVLEPFFYQKGDPRFEIFEMASSFLMPSFARLKYFKPGIPLSDSTTQQFLSLCLNI